MGVRCICFGPGRIWLHDDHVSSQPHFFFFGQKTAYEVGLGIPAEPLFRSMGKVMRHTLGASLNIRHNLSSSKGPKPLQLKLLTTYIPKRSEERFSRNAETELVCRLLLEKKNTAILFTSIRSARLCTISRLAAISASPLNSAACATASIMIRSSLFSVAEGGPSVMHFIFTHAPTPEIYTLSLHDALPICSAPV